MIYILLITGSMGNPGIFVHNDLNKCISHREQVHKSNPHLKAHCIKVQEVTTKETLN